VRTLKLVLEYDGTAYQGWQIQARGPTIQGVIEEKLATLTGTRVRLIGAGRTDSGVHAWRQVASFRTEHPIPTEKLQRALNALLPRDIAVLSAEEAAADFDARRNARGKRYRYQIWNSRVRSAFHERFTWQVAQTLDVAAMRRAAAHLVGEHDFSALRAADCPARHAVRTVRRVDCDDSARPMLAIDVEATAFLKHMVRNLVGTLVEVGLGKRDPASIPELLQARDRTRAGPTAPARGLFLAEVFYP
jgi:tRNA pseudouridine38-40 synthase